MKISHSTWIELVEREAAHERELTVLRTACDAYANAYAVLTAKASKPGTGRHRAEW